MKTKVWGFFSMVEARKKMHQADDGRPCGNSSPQWLPDDDPLHRGRREHGPRPGHRFRPSVPREPSATRRYPGVVGRRSRDAWMAATVETCTPCGCGRFRMTRSVKRIRKSPAASPLVEQSFLVPSGEAGRGNGCATCARDLCLERGRPLQGRETAVPRHVRRKRLFARNPARLRLAPRGSCDARMSRLAPRSEQTRIRLRWLRLNSPTGFRPGALRDQRCVSLTGNRALLLKLFSIRSERS